MANKYAYRTHTGLLLDLSNPRPEDVCLADIAHHLARICRFGGAVDDYYSVASHCVYVSRIVAAGAGTTGRRNRSALLHDAAEAYLGDMVSGLKRLNPDYKELEDLWCIAIEERFDVSFRRCPVIKDADLRARLSEARDLFDVYPRAELLGGEDDHEPWPERCVPLAPNEAEWEFLAVAYRLGLGVT